MVCGGQESGGWHTVSSCRTIRLLTARVRASPWRNSEGRESAGSTTGSIASAWRWRHLEATDAPGTTWWPSPTGGLSTAAASCADAALNRTPDTAPAPGAGFGCGGRSDASAIPSCAWITVRLGSPLATVATATRLGKLGSATARGRGGRDGSYSRSRISALPSRPGAPLSSTTLTSEPRTMRERRHSPAKPSTIAWRASS